ncbi:LysM peptidoglycan-binding domain-containing protein [Geomonas sp.]|uniref:LysM peptidoglycan-binding domain-containing protein n=1 Tax=Geomonas sp. TaxID=2651584 RepID=UPI002B47E5C6|nr:LysM peptidoglycan-binding domain-containing protein [Geomonas sp.]
MPTAGHAQTPSFDIDIKELERPAPPPTRKIKKAPEKRKKTAPVTAESAHKPGHHQSYRTYTVRPGDYLFKILVARFGMTNDQAESVLPEVIRINHLSNPRELEVGRKLMIPRPAPSHVSPGAGKEDTKGGGKIQATEAAKEATLSRQPQQGMAAGGCSSTPAAPIPAAALPVAAAQTPPPSAATWLCPVADRDPGRMVESILSALAISWCSNRTIQSDHSASVAFSIRADRYFEHKGERYIVSIGEADAYTNTLLRLLENAGYRVLRLGARDDFKAVGEKLLRLLGVASEYGKHAEGGKEITGFLVQQENAGGRRVVITAEAVAPDQKWVMAPGCGAK